MANVLMYPPVLVLQGVELNAIVKWFQFNLDNFAIEQAQFWNIESFFLASWQQQ